MPFTYLVDIIPQFLMTEQRQPKELPRLIGLPMPYEGVTEEVFFDYLMDRQSFTKNALDNLKEENPHLLKYLIRDVMISVSPDESLGWVLMYYEILSRSAQREGAHVFLVSGDALASFSALELRDLTVGDEEEALRYIHEKDEKQKGLVQAELLKSKELGEFWSCITVHTTHVAFSYGSFERADEEVRIAYSLLEILKEQEKRNNFRDKFPQ